MSKVRVTPAGDRAFRTTRVGRYYSLLIGRQRHAFVFILVVQKDAAPQADITASGLRCFPVGHWRPGSTTDIEPVLKRVRIDPSDLLGLFFDQNDLGQAVSDKYRPQSRMNRNHAAVGECNTDLTQIIVIQKHDTDTA